MKKGHSALRPIKTTIEGPGKCSIRQVALIGAQEVHLWTLIEKWKLWMSKFKLMKLSYRSIKMHKMKSQMPQRNKDLNMITKGNKLRIKQKTPVSLSVAVTAKFET